MKSSSTCLGTLSAGMERVVNVIAGKRTLPRTVVGGFSLTPRLSSLCVPSRGARDLVTREARAALTSAVMTYNYV